MQRKYLQVAISAEDKKQTDKILNVLLDKKLVTGGQMVRAPARFRWKGEIVNMDYITIYSYTKSEYKEKIITEVEKVSVEEVPMITFTKFEGNKKLLDWIDKTLK